MLIIRPAGVKGYAKVMAMSVFCDEAIQIATRGVIVMARSALCVEAIQIATLRSQRQEASLATTTGSCHCETRSDEAIQITTLRSQRQEASLATTRGRTAWRGVVKTTM